ncbi:MAG: exo-alpha-sialidase, partial [Bryobacterales bacterium]|nr:exo-alpha-sialidase [Bryobacterales bacterium]
GPGVGIQIKHGPHAGRLVIPCDHNYDDPVEKKHLSGSHTIYSDDRGKTWKLGGVIRPKVNECQVVELADGERTLVTLERCTDSNRVRYRDPLTGTDVVLPAQHARRWKVHLKWLREEIITALGAALQGVRGKHQDDEPVFLGELNVDGHDVALYFAAKMASERQYAKVDAALRLRPRNVPGIVLT